MIEVHQHPDGMVYVRTDNGTYCDTPANLAIDFGEVLSALPEWANDRIYAPGVRHAIMGPNGRLDGGPMPWDLGDRLIAAVARLISAKASREAPPPAGPPPRRRVPKSLVVKRLNDAGKLAAASAALNADLYARERWYATDQPSIYADAQDALALLKSIGADPAVILAE
jgi:hypothetical protein